MTPQSDQVSRQRERLLPCPFCGEAENIAESGDNGYGAFWCCCDACGASTGEWHVSSQAEANARWNRRAALALPSETPEPAIQELRNIEDALRYCISVFSADSGGIDHGHRAMEKARAALAALSETPANDCPTCGYVPETECTACGRAYVTGLREGYAVALNREPPSETPVGHQIERDGKESGAVGGDHALWRAYAEGRKDEREELAAQVPRAWFRVHRTPDDPSGPYDADIDMVWGDQPEGEDGWKPLYLGPAEREASTPSARSDIQGPVFISELSAAGEKSGAVGGESA